MSLIVVDNLHLIRRADHGLIGNPPFLDESLKGLKYLAEEIQSPVIAIAQLDAGIDIRNGRRPMLSDLPQSDAFQRWADTIFLIHRDEQDCASAPEPEFAELIIAKQNDGAIGTVRLAFRHSLCHFESLSPAGAGSND